MKIILPKIIYKLFIYQPSFPKWLLLDIKLKITPLVMGNSFKCLLPFLKNE